MQNLAINFVNKNDRFSNKFKNKKIEIAIVYVKIKIVYFKKNKKDFVKYNIVSILKKISEFLDNDTQKILKIDSFRFFQQLQLFVDNKKKNARIQTNNKKSGEQTRELYITIRLNTVKLISLSY